MTKTKNEGQKKNLTIEQLIINVKMYHLRWLKIKRKQVYDRKKTFGNPCQTSPHRRLMLIDVTLRLGPSPAYLVNSLFQLTLGCPLAAPFPASIPDMTQNILNQWYMIVARVNLFP